MACAEANFLLGCERNSDIVLGSAYDALIKHYYEEPNTVAVIKNTANKVLKTMSYYVQKLFAHVVIDEYTGPTCPSKAVTGCVSLPIKARDIAMFNPVNYNGKTGQDNAVRVMSRIHVLPGRL